MQALSWSPGSYGLGGPQVDPYGAKALANSGLHIPTIEEIRAVGDPLLRFYPFPLTEADLKAELDELVELKRLRCDQGQIGGEFHGRKRRKLSRFLNERAGQQGESGSGQAVNGIPFSDQHKVGGPCITTGADLARWFENDTPLLGGWMALNVLLSENGKPPTEQAFIWTALNTAISAALLAAWHYKWFEPQSRLKPRPTEAIENLRLSTDLDVLYAKSSDPFSGVPRHPTYPSGHSTVGGATAGILKRFFPSNKAVEALDDLADNAGLARMWAGIHYRADHEFGIALGEAVAKLVYS
jgi:hypothetical protein